MREPVRKVIDGEEYTFCQLPPKQSIRLLTRILKIIGPALGGAVSGGNVQSILDLDIDPGMIVSNLCSRLDESDVEYVVDVLLSQVLHSGSGDISKVFDQHFAGRLPHLFKVIGTALEVQYGDFFGGKLDVAGLLKGRATPQVPQT
jgi:hypothetical protein